MNNVEPLLSDLVAIDSINPDLVTGVAGEGAIAAFISRWMEASSVMPLKSCKDRGSLILRRCQGIRGDFSRGVRTSITP